MQQQIQDVRKQNKGLTCAAMMTLHDVAALEDVRRPPGPTNAHPHLQRKQHKGKKAHIRGNISPATRRDTPTNSGTAVTIEDYSQRESDVYGTNRQDFVLKLFRRKRGIQNQGGHLSGMAQPARHRPGHAGEAPPRAINNANKRSPQSQNTGKTAKTGGFRASGKIEIYLKSDGDGGLFASLATIIDTLSLSD